MRINTQHWLTPTAGTWRRALLLVLALQFYASITHAPVAAQDVAQPEQQLTQVNSAIEEIQSWLNSAANNRTTQERSLRRVTTQIDSLNTEITENMREISELSAHLSDLTARSTSLEAQKTATEEQLRSALRASYRSGQESYLKLLLNQEDPALSARMLQYFERFNRQRSEQIRAFRETIAEIAALRIETEQTSHTLAAQQSELTRQQLALTSDQDSRSALLKELDSSIASRSSELEQLQQNRQRLEALIEKIAEAIANIPPPDQLTPFAQAKGAMPLPLNGRIGSRFGASYSDGNLHRQGVIILAEAGSPVRAVHPGRVVFADWLRGSGLLVVIDHGEGYLSLYANNQALAKSKGDWVNRGEALATASSDAGTGAAGIYFEIRHNGTAQDPLTWCSI
jgi:septal ring factor EnvC (AmiA/AmiB activator)